MVLNGILPEKNLNGNKASISCSVFLADLSPITQVAKKNKFKTHARPLSSLTTNQIEHPIYKPFDSI
jgi:hypothetical protein